MRGFMVVAALLLGMSHQAAALTEGLVDYIDSDCSEKLTTIYRTYYPAPAGTACVDILNRTLTETDPALCPSNSSAIACFNQQQTQWLAFVAECDVFHYADFNRGPDVPPGEGAPASTSSSNSTSRRRSLLSSSSSGFGNGTSAADYIAGIFYAAIAYDTSGPTVNNGCFPTMNVPSDFYSYLQGQPLFSAASSRFAGSAAAVMVVAAGAAAVLLIGI